MGHGFHGYVSHNQRVDALNSVKPGRGTNVSLTIDFPKMSSFSNVFLWAVEIVKKMDINHVRRGCRMEY